MNIYQMLAYEGMRTFVGPWVSLALRVHVDGADNIPDECGALLVCNHRSMLDPLVLMTEVDRFMHFIAGAQGSVLPMLKTFYRMTGTVRPSGKDGRRAATGLDEAARLLDAGELVCVFPEGIDSLMRPDMTSQVSYFRTGFARVALDAGVPIIPAAIIPTDEIKLPPIAEQVVESYEQHTSVKRAPFKYLLYKKVLLRIGSPISLEGFTKEPLTKASIDMLSGKVRQVIMKLYNGWELDRFMYGKVPFDVYTDRV